MNTLTTILGDKYDSNFLSSPESYSEILNKEGILVFKEFLNSNTLNKILDEATKLKPKAYKSSSEYNVYVKPTDPKFSLFSARNRLMKTTKMCIPNDLLMESSDLLKIYNSNEIKSFFSCLLGVSKLYQYSDQLSSVNINYYNPGDALGWHFDNSDFTITLLIKNCLKGGLYQYFTDMRYNEDGSENYKLVDSILNNELEPKSQSTKAGDLMIFRGNKSLHRVTNVIEGERILVTFNYNIYPDVALSEQSRKTFFGRIE
ncbi:MAG: arpA protein [Flavobacteriaceae bacterium]|nr:arpA protein [Flavobacteriaceae bacterium]|tara:strand:- start:52202 stop:52978 length:777 start_codon:yes stop_codon:yes gene_type:complete